MFVIAIYVCCLCLAGTGVTFFSKESLELSPVRVVNAPKTKNLGIVLILAALVAAAVVNFALSGNMSTGAQSWPWIVVGIAFLSPIFASLGLSEKVEGTDPSGKNPSA